MSKILVTGGAGFIGSNLVDALIEENHEVAVVDNLSTGKKENVNPKAKFFEVDITDETALKSVFAEFSPEVIFHLAAQASVRMSVENPAEDIKINVIGTINLLELAVQNKIEKFIFSSTGGAIYGDGASRPTTEEAEEEPACPYGLDKLAAEKYIGYFATTSDLQTICLRYANVYGPRQNPKGEAGVVAIFAAKMLSGEPVQVNGTGEQTRDFVYVSDVVEANLKALESKKSGIYNIGSGIETNINEIAETMKEISESQSEITKAKANPGEQMKSSLSAEKAKAELGFEIKTTIKEGLEKTINYFKNASS